MALNKETATWLVEEYNPIRGHRINHQTIAKHVKAINILLDQNREVPKCATCEWRTIGAIGNNVYEQFQSEIEEIYNKPARGRKKKNV